MTKLYAVRAHVRRAPSRPASYTTTHRALIADARRDPAINLAYRARRARAAQARFDAAMEQMACELETALTEALRGEMEAGS